MQHQRLGDLLRHAHDHVPYYRELLERCGVVDATGGVDLTAFDTVPFLDKDIIRSRSEELLSDDLEQRPWFRNYSGGSTGEPVAFVQEQREDDHWSRAVTLLFDEWSGRGPGDRCALLWGSERDLAGAPSWRVRYRRRTRRMLVLNAFGMTPEHMGEYVKALNRVPAAPDPRLRREPLRAGAVHSGRRPQRVVTRRDHDLRREHLPRTTGAHRECVPRTRLRSLRLA